MSAHERFRTFPALAAVAILLPVGALLGEQIQVRHTEGLQHGFLVLRDLDDKILASGDWTQSAIGNRVSSELILHFKDGSVHEETTIFSQRRAFQLIRYHLVQKGQAFKRFTDMSLNGSTGEVTVRYTEDGGLEKAITEHLKLPPDVANGFVPTLLSDLDPKLRQAVVSMVVSTPKPRLVKLAITPDGEDSFMIGGSTRKALRYVAKVEIGGITGVAAGILGKQPPDTHIWTIGGNTPGFLKSEGPLYEGGPIWRIELASPVWGERRSGAGASASGQK